MAIGPNVVDDCEGMTEEDYWRGMYEAKENAGIPVQPDSKLPKEKMMLPITERAFMQELRDTANGMAVANLNSDWVRAYEALADAADRLDAMQARLDLPPNAKVKGAAK